MNATVQMNATVLDYALKYSFCVCDKIKETLFITWCISSLGTPFLGYFYVNWLGKCVNMEVLGESGIIKITEKIKKETKEETKEESKEETVEVTREVTKEEKNYCFFDDLRFTNIGLPICILLGPIAIPFSIFFVLKATVDLVAYKLNLF